MKLILLSFTIFITFLNTYAQTYGIANNDISLFTKYKIPETKLSILNLGGDLYITTNEFNSVDNPINHDSFRRDLTTSLNSRYYYLKESDYRVMSIIGQADLNYMKSKNETNYIQWNDSKSLFLNLSFNFKDYLELNRPFYYGILSEVNVYMSEYKNEFHNSVNINGNKTQIYRLGFNFGFGHLRNVTPIVSALRLQERMKQLNLITDNLPDNEIATLAETFARHGYYSDAYERYGKIFWNDLFSSTPFLQQKLNSLNPFAIEYLKEVTQELKVIRREGYFIQANLLFEYDNNYNSSDYGDPELRHRQTNIIEQYYIKPGVSASFAKQLTLESQIQLNCSFDGGPNINKDSDVKQDYDLSLGVSYDHELTDRFITSISLGYLYSITNQSKQEIYKQFRGKLSLNYFIEDYISLSLNYQYEYTSYNQDSVFGGSSLENNSLRIGFNYFFSKSILF